MLPNPQIFGGIYTWYNIVSHGAILVYSIFFITYGIKKMNFKFLELFIILYLCTMIGVIGSRGFSVLEKFFLSDFSFYQYDFIGDFQYGSGHRWFGSLALILLLSPIILLRYSKENFLSVLDLICLGACLSLIIGKIACFLDGHWGCYGIATNLPWGVTFPYGKAPTLIPVHPIQVYDSIFHALLFIALLRRKKRFMGETAILFLLLTSVYNILIECIRTNHSVFWKLSFAQEIYFIIFLITFLYSMKFMKKGHAHHDLEFNNRI
jgi:prolipoprotein diacylglyceryltransferase